MICEVMSFVCSDSREHSITREQVLAKVSGKPTFSEYLWFQRNALKFLNCQMHELTCGTLWWKKKQVQEAEFQERFWKEQASLQLDGVFIVSDFTACPYLKLAAGLLDLDMLNLVWASVVWTLTNRVQHVQLVLTYMAVSPPPSPPTESSTHQCHHDAADTHSSPTWLYWISSSN